MVWWATTTVHTLAFVSRRGVSRKESKVFYKVISFAFIRQFHTYLACDYNKVKCFQRNIKYT